MKKRYIFTKTIWQILIYLFEVVSVSILIAHLTMLIEGVNSAYAFIERCVLCYTFYQILVIVILTNVNDIEKDSYLTYINNLKKCILYTETKKKYIKDDILQNIEYQLDNATFNNTNFRKAYIMIKDNIDNLKIDSLNMEILNAEKMYEMNSLNWRYSFLLRVIK